MTGPHFADLTLSGTEWIAELIDIASEEDCKKNGADGVSKAKDTRHVAYFLDAGMIVSFMAWHEHSWDPPVDVTYQWIDMAWTMPNYRRRHHYTRLFEAFEDLVHPLEPRRIACGIPVTNTVSMLVHRKLGMHTCEALDYLPELLVKEI